MKADEIINVGDFKTTAIVWNVVCIGEWLETEKKERWERKEKGKVLVYGAFFENILDGTAEKETYRQTNKMEEKTIDKQTGM